MPFTRQVTALATGLALSGLVGACAPSDPRPPTGEGQMKARVLFVAIVVLALSGGVALAWLHLHVGSRSQRKRFAVWVAVAWCFLVAAIAAVPTGFAALVSRDLARRPPATRGAERENLDLLGVLASYAVPSLVFALFVVAVGLGLRRGERWARAATVVLCSLLSAGGLFIGVVVASDDEGGFTKALAVAFTLIGMATVPIPFLFFRGAERHFPPDPVTPAMVPSQPRLQSESPTELQELSRRWHDRA